MAKEQEKTVDQKRIAVLLTSILIMKLATQTVAKKSTELRKLVKSFDDLIDDTVHLCMCEVCTDTAYAAICGRRSTRCISWPRRRNRISTVMATRI